MKIILAFSCLLLLSCSSENQKREYLTGNTAPQEIPMLQEEMEIEPPRNSALQNPIIQTLDKGSKIMKEGNMAFEVTEIEKAKQGIDAILRTHNGYYEQEQYNDYGNRNTYALILRVPNAQFDNLIDDIESGSGQLKQKNIRAKDVSEEYVDLNIRLENNMVYLNRYKDLVKQMSTTTEIVEMQEKIRRIESEIESKKGRLRSLEDRVQYSRVSIELSELVIKNIASRPGFGKQLINALANGAMLLSSLILGFVNFWPLVLLFAIGFVGRKSLMKSIMK